MKWACNQLRCADWSGKGAPGQAAALQRGGLRCASTALRCSCSWPRRRTHFVRCAHAVHTTATNQTTKRAARAAKSLPLLGTSQARRSLPERAFADPGSVFAKKRSRLATRQAVPGRGELCGDEKASLGHKQSSGLFVPGERPGHWPGARSAHQYLTRRGCLNAVSAANKVSSATRLQADAASPDTEQSLRTALCLASALALASARARSAVGPQGRPPRCEPLPGTACRVALVNRGLPNATPWSL